MIVGWIVTAILCVAFGYMLFRRLRVAGYSFAWAAIFAGVALAQPGFVLSEYAPWLLLFAFLSYAVAARIADFARYQDARRIVLLGTSLAGAELVGPLGGALTLAALPFVLPLAGIRQERPRAAGLLLLLLFLPVITAFALSQPWPTHGVASIVQWLGPTKSIHGVSPKVGLAFSVFPLVPVLALSTLFRAGNVAAIAATIAVLGGMAIVERFQGSADYTLALLSGTGPLVTLAISDWSDAKVRSSEALTCSVGGTLLSWLIALVLRMV